MEKRTMDRKAYDIKILNEMIEEDPNDSRAYYYLGQTYNLLEQHQLAFDNFIKRVRHHHHGFLQERVDACFEAARISDFMLKRNWEETEKLYLEAYSMDISRPDSLYFIGIHYYLNHEFEKSYIFFKEAYRVGYPVHCQYSLKPTLSYFYLPKFLSEVSYRMNDVALGKEITEFFMKHNKKEDCVIDYYTMSRWNRIFSEMEKTGRIAEKGKFQKKKNTSNTIVFLVDGGFDRWSGESIENKGVGGSETHVIEMSRCLVLKGFEVIVFCNCNEESIYQGVEYKKLTDYINYLEVNNVSTVIVSRYPEYLGKLYAMDTVKEVVLFLHDMIPEGEIILRHPKLKKIILLSDYHKQVFDNMYQPMTDITVVVGYGINRKNYTEDDEDEEKKESKVFMYSSMANRGLYYLLLMWRKIREKYVDAVLLVHTDLENGWLNRIEPVLMKETKRLMYELRDEGVEDRGWTSKKELYQSWKKATVWFYPTDFIETFCLTAYEAGLFNCVCIASNKGSLTTTVGERGFLLDMELGSDEGRDKVVKDLFDILDNESAVKDKVKLNHDWVSKQTWESRCEDMLIHII